MQGKSTFILPDLQNNILRKITMSFYDTPDNPAFESYLDSLLTNHSESLKELDIPHSGWFKNSNYEFTVLRKLYFGGGYTSKELVNVLKLCPNLLELEGFRIDDSEENEDLNIVEEEATHILPKLMRFNCRRYNGKDINLVLKMFPGLKELTLENGIYGCFMRGLSSTYLPYLMKLHIFGYDIDDGIEIDTFDIGKAAGNFPKLEDLVVSDCRIEISDSVQEFHFPCLQKLKLEDVEIDDDNIKILTANLPEAIDLSKCWT